MLICRELSNIISYNTYNIILYSIEYMLKVKRYTNYSCVLNL